MTFAHSVAITNMEEEKTKIPIHENKIENSSAFLVTIDHINLHDNE